MKTLGLLVAILAIAGIMGIVVGVKVSVWNECRAGHSMFYCWHLVAS